MAQYIDFEEFFKIGDELDAISHLDFYKWMQQYQDISAAKRILEIETDLELYNKFKESKHV